jgi:hypothetical protein
MKNQLSMLQASAQMVVLLFPILWAPPCRAQDWTLTSAPPGNYFCVGISPDGTKLMAMSDTAFSSTNGGATWTSNSWPATGWYFVDSFNDGNGWVAAAAGLRRGIYVSTNIGVTWTKTIAPDMDWYSVTCSEDGSKIAAVGGSVSVHISTNSGNSWTEVALPKQARTIASSSDGTIVAAASLAGGPIYFSTNSGFNWIPSSSPSNWWQSVACSADGTKWIAAASVAGNPGSIFTSSDSGMTWTSNNVPALYWFSVAFSADGSRLAAVAAQSAAFPGGGPIFTSTNMGISWISNSAPATNNWRGVASSADGCKLVAAASDKPIPPFSSVPGRVYAWQTPPTPTLTLNRHGSGLRLAWTVPSMQFELQQNPTPDLTTWSIVNREIITTTNLQKQLLLPTIDERMFYRLKR